MTTTSFPIPASLPAAPPPSAIFRAMLFKELRELAPWAALLALVYSLALAFALHQSYTTRIDGNWNNGGYGFSILSEPFQLATAFIPALGALLLGFIQCFSEAAPDRYGFLVHRPASRSRLFLTKNLAAAILYIAATFIPLALAILWAKNPRHLPLPFTWDMTLPSISDLLAAFSFYFAGILIARRTDARWYASRLLPLALPVLAFACTFPCTSFFYALLITLLAYAITAAAARGSFLAAAQFPPQSKPAKTALAAILIAGLLVAIFLSAALLAAFFSHDNTYRITSTGFLRDGTPVLEIRDNTKTLYQHLDGKEFTELQGGPEPWRQLLPMTSLNREDSFGPRDFTSFHMPTHYFMPEFLGSDYAWFRHYPGDYLVGYNPRQRTLIALVGPEGFAPNATVPPTRFPQPLIYCEYAFTLLLASGENLYRFNPDFSLTPLFQTPDHHRITFLGILSPSQHIANDGIALATDNALTILNLDGQPLVTYAHPIDPKTEIAVARLPESDQFLIDYKPYDQHHKQIPPHLAVYVTAAGAVDHTLTLPPDSQSFPGDPEWFQSCVLPLAVTPALAAAAIPLTWWLTGDMPYPQIDPDVITMLAHGLYYALPAALLILLLARRYQLPRLALILWPLAALAFGPAALLLFFCLRPLAFRTSCPNCQKPRPVTADSCPHCQSPFPAPALTGTEIFSP